MWACSWSLAISNYLDIMRHPTFSYIRQILSLGQLNSFNHPTLGTRVGDLESDTHVMISIYHTWPLTFNIAPWKGTIPHKEYTLPTSNHQIFKWLCYIIFPCFFPDVLMASWLLQGRHETVPFGGKLSPRLLCVKPLLPWWLVFTSGQRRLGKLATSGGKKGAKSGDLNTWDLGWFKHGSFFWDIIGISNDMHQYMKCFLHQRYYYLQTNKHLACGEVEEKRRWQTLSIWQRRKVDIRFKWTNDLNSTGRDVSHQRWARRGEIFVLLGDFEIWQFLFKGNNGGWLLMNHSVRFDF